MTYPIHVVAGIISDSAGRVLLAQRLPDTHLAGKWEFPGGKIEDSESAEHALRRELHEELGIDAGAIEPLISVPWSYPGKAIVLHALRVVDFSGDPRGRQGQALRWIDPNDMRQLPMPPADRPIVTALRLPREYAITPEPTHDTAAFLEQIDVVAAAPGMRLLQLRAKALPAHELHALASAAQARVKASGTALLLNGNVDLVRSLDLDGVHLPAAELMRLHERPLGADRWVAASCHDEKELAHAAAIGVDFAVLGPVLPPRSHPGLPALGWARFAALRAPAPFPVYALGGLGLQDLPAALAAGAQGVAGISAFWPTADQ